MDTRTNSSDLTDEQACDLLDSIFGLHTEHVDSRCSVHTAPTATCCGGALRLVKSVPAGTDTARRR